MIYLLKLKITHGIKLLVKKSKRDYWKHRIKSILLNSYSESEYLKYSKDEWIEDKISYAPNRTKKLSEINQDVFPKPDLEGIRCDEGQKDLLETLDKW